MSGEIDHVRDLLYGALTMGCLVASLSFLRFWKHSRDRLFALFSAAFAILSLNWIAMPFVPAEHESRELFYLFRLVAFAIILAAIVDKNRKPR